MKFNLIRIGFLYLVIPFLIFSIGFLRPLVSIPLLVISLWIGKVVWDFTKEEAEIKVQARWHLLVGILLVIFWVLLSGVGGIAFQNFDFHGRNAIFRDLVNLNWPVHYSFAQNPKDFALVYYIGFWLPAAVIGKAFGWTAANIALFLWVGFGLYITTLLISQLTKLNLTKSILLMIFFSGMDIFGVIILSLTNPFYSYPGLWPPIQHLEWWTNNFQLSSFTTQLFWVFNQAIPAWICTASIVSLKKQKLIPIFLALCAFFSPFPAIGLALISVVLVLEKSLIELSPDGFSKPILEFCRNLTQKIRSFISWEIIIYSLVVFTISYLYFTANSSSGNGNLQNLNLYQILIFIIFAIVEWLFLWLILLKGHERQPIRYIVAVILLLSPLVRIAGTDIFSSRATIPALILLLIWTGQALAEANTKKKIILIAIITIGAFTPIYEINRSLYRTVQWYFFTDKVQAASSIPDNLLEEIKFPEHPEYDHPYSLLADDWYSLSRLRLDQLSSYVGETSTSVFFQYLAKR